VNHPSLKERLIALIRGRYLISVLGCIVMYLKPEIGSNVVAIVGLACGVSAIDSWKGNGLNKNEPKS